MTSSLELISLTMLNESFTLPQVEEHVIKAAMIRFNGNKTYAARAIGMGRRTLYRKLAEMKARDAG